MIIKGQNGKNYDIYELGIMGCEIYCKDNADRRRKHILGKYINVFRATDVYREILNCVDEYYKMPEE